MSIETYRLLMLIGFGVQAALLSLSAYMFWLSEEYAKVRFLRTLEEKRARLRRLDRLSPLHWFRRKSSE